MDSTTTPIKIQSKHADSTEPRRDRLVHLGPSLAIGVGMVSIAAALMLTKSVTQASNLADQIQGECHAGKLAGPVCDQASRVVVTPFSGPNDDVVPTFKLQHFTGNWEFCRKQTDSNPVSPTYVCDRYYPK